MGGVNGMVSAKALNGLTQVFRVKWYVRHMSHSMNMKKSVKDFCEEECKM